GDGRLIEVPETLLTAGGVLGETRIGKARRRRGRIGGTDRQPPERRQQSTDPCFFRVTKPRVAGQLLRVPGELKACPIDRTHFGSVPIDDPRRRFTKKVQGAFEDGRVVQQQGEQWPTGACRRVRSLQAVGELTDDEENGTRVGANG